MNRIAVKIILIFVIIFLLIPIKVNYAAGAIDTGGYSPTLDEQDEFDKVGNVIIGTIQVFGSFISVITLIIIGIKFMLGSVEEKAEYKKSMFPYIIGAILLFATTNIAKVLLDIAGKI